jgi:hypothetical protein
VETVEDVKSLFKEMEIIAHRMVADALQMETAANWFVAATRNPTLNAAAPTRLQLDLAYDIIRQIRGHCEFIDREQALLAAQSVATRNLLNRAEKMIQGLGEGA